MKSTIRGFLGQQFLGALGYFRLPHYRERWGGAFNGQGFRQKIFLECLQSLSIDAIFETGTFCGSTTEFMARNYSGPVYSVEMNDWFFGYSRTRLRKFRNVKLFHGDSRTVLGRSLRGLEASHVFFYLDAHWNNDLPLVAELNMVFESVEHPIVMIDDFQVPDDPGYSYDDYGGMNLNLSLLGPSIRQLGLDGFFPACRSDDETGAKRGCIVLARGETSRIIERDVGSLRRI